MVAAVLMLAAGTCFAQDNAIAFLNGLNQEVVAEVAATGLDERDRERNFRAILERVFGMDEICQQVLGRYGRTASAEQREEFRQLFENMLVMTWARRFRDYTGNGVQFDGAVAAGNGDVLVRSKVEGQDHQPISVEWRLRGDGENYRLLDISAEGVSMLLTYRSEYQSVLRNSGITGLNDLLRKKVGDLGKAG